MTSVHGDITIAVRLEGGIGDHILGMRILPFVRRRYPKADITVFSDAAGHPDQLAVAAMSPFVDHVVPVFHDVAKVKWENMGHLKNIQQQYLDMMFAADLFLDACGASMFVAESHALDVPVFDILAARTELLIPADARHHAATLAADYGEARFVALSLTKYGPDVLGANQALLSRIVSELLADPTVLVLNFFTSSFAFSHWPDPNRSVRRAMAEGEAALLRELWSENRRVIPCVDLPIGTVAALLERCAYCVGVDNGIKHLAWALDVPRTYLHVGAVSAEFVLRWMPDFHRMLSFNSDLSRITAHIEMAKRSLVAPTVAGHTLKDGGGGGLSDTSRCSH